MAIRQSTEEEQEYLRLLWDFMGRREDKGEDGASAQWYSSREKDLLAAWLVEGLIERSPLRECNDYEQNRGHEHYVFTPKGKQFLAKWLLQTAVT